MDPNNRWRQLLSIVGALITLSAVGAELSGYTQFLSTLNDGINWLLSLLGIGEHRIVASKIAIIAIVIWMLFYLALGQYSLKYENCDMDKWIFRQKIFLKVNREESRRVMRLTKLALFLAAPIKALLTLTMPPWTGTRKIFLISEMPVHAKPYLIEALFFHAVLAAGGMAIYLGLRLITTLT